VVRVQTVREIDELLEIPPARDGTHVKRHESARYMPTAIDVFAKVRGHERAEQLQAAREADLLPASRATRASSTAPAPRSSATGPA
jgi:hypothetical protein